MSASKETGSTKDKRKSQQIKRASEFEMSNHRTPPKIEVMTANEWVAIATWFGAAVSLSGAFLSIWWPWHTRKIPVLKIERAYPDLAKEQFAALIVATGLQRPELFNEVRNDGDGIAHALELHSDEASESRFLRIIGDSRIEMSERWAALNAGERVFIVTTPRTDQDVDVPVIDLGWAEQPIRLKRSHKRKQFEGVGRLPAMRSLGDQERTLAHHLLSASAAQHGYSTQAWVELLGLDGRRLYGPE